MSSWYLLVGLALLWVICRVAKPRALGSKEPVVIPQTIPYLGHLIGIIQYGSGYYTKICSRFPTPIYTLSVFGKRIYIVNDPSLVAAVDRNSKAISFAPYLVQFAKRILIPSRKGLEALAANMNEDDGAWGCRPETLKAMHASLMPGEHLNSTTQTVLRSVRSMLSSDGSISQLLTAESFDLFSWVRKLITRASTDAIYGEKANPFKDPKVEASFWAIDKDFTFLGLNFLPSIIASTAYRARQTLFDAFHKYYEAGGHESGSRLIRARYEVNRKYDICQKDIEHFDLSVCYGLLVNTVPATSWSLYYIYSQPPLLSEIRTELSQLVHNSLQPSGSVLRHVNLHDVINQCHLLASVIKETLRVQSTNAAGRAVLEDTLIDNRYLLKKDSMLLLPSAELHQDKAIWGPSCDTFDPKRFLKHQREGRKIPASAFRAFGGGASHCPGRHLAMNEIMIVLSMIILQYDLQPVDDLWKTLKSRPHITTSILTPDEDISVKASIRQDLGRGDWEFTWKIPSDS